MAKAKKLPSGTWRCIASFTDEEGKYKQKSFTAPTKKEAEYKANTFLMDKKDGMRPENKTLGQLADAFIENRSAILSPSTIRGYRLIRKTAFQDIVNVRLGILTKEMYQKAINTYAKERSPKTVLSAHAFYNKLLKENGYDIGEGVNLPQKRKTEIEIPTEEELSAFLNEVKGTDNYFNGSFGKVANTLTVQYRYKTQGENYGSWTTVTATKSGNTYSATASISGLNYLN